MQRKPGIPAVYLLIALLLFQGVAPNLQIQAQTTQTAPPTPQQLDQLLAPVALYPDALLAQITSASTNPQEILDVDNWLAQNSNLTSTALSEAAQQQGFDPAFVALVQFPTVLQMMAENIDDYAAIGQAVIANQAEVTASIQRLRAQAYAAGSLRTTPQQTVTVDQGAGQPVYVIQPANQAVVYVPQYDPTVVYVGPSTGTVVAASLISFGLGIGIGALLYSNQPWGWGGWGWNWRGGGIYYNHAVWGGWHGGYHPPRPWYRPRPVPYTGRPGYGGNWHYRPPNYRPPTPINRPGYNRPGHGNRPVYGRPGSRPPVNPPNNRPGNPGNRPSNPGNRPGNPGHRPTNPGNGGRPVNQPARPGTPNQRPPQTRPPNQNRPTPTPRPTPQPRPQQQHRPTTHNRPTPQHRPTHSTARPSGGHKPAQGGGGQKPR